AVGAFLVTGALLALTVLWPALGRLVGAIPKQIASAMLAGVIFSFCVAPFQGAIQYPVIVLPAILVWLILYRFAPLWAAPVAIVLVFSLIGLVLSPSVVNVTMFPRLALVSPGFDLAVILSVSLPLYLVTMASQNVPGIAIMATFGYTVPFRPVLVSTGLATIFGSIFGGYALNLAAITAALNANEHAHKDANRRWLSSVYGGVAYLVLALLAAPAVAFVLETPRVLILAASGIALFGTIAAALQTATEEPALRLPAVITFLAGASGIAAFGIGAAFWALTAGVLVWLWTRPRTGSEGASKASS
ncbi:MAG: benzoate/H(+) symporter BenE family transporter, partial [Micrococcales bacterium]